jgi:hypothetical protein
MAMSKFSRIHLCPSTLVAEANYLVYFPCRQDASTQMNGLQPAKKPSMHGFKATNTLLNLLFLPTFSNSICTLLPRDLSSIYATQLKRS